MRRVLQTVAILSGMWGLVLSCTGLAAESGAVPGSASHTAGPVRRAEAASGDSVQIFGEEEPAAAEKKAGESTRKPAGSALSTLARAGFWLGVVLVLLCGLVLAGRRFLPKSMGMFRSPAMEVMGRSFLDPKRSVYLLKVGGRVLVVGSAENGLTCLSEIGDAQEVAHLSAIAANHSEDSAGGENRFARAFGEKVGRLSRLVRRGGPQVEEDCADLGYEHRPERRIYSGPVAAIGSEEVNAGRDGGADFEELKERIEGLKARLKTIS